uniref:Uncharacterized protein n=1 Tax=Capra hircus TaxID=9925 RepID=A0A8C2RBL4_CAPHI
MTGDTDKYLGPQDLKELGDDSLPAEGYMGFSLGARSASHASSIIAEEFPDRMRRTNLGHMFK